MVEKVIEDELEPLKAGGSEEVNQAARVEGSLGVIEPSEEIEDVKGGYQLRNALDKRVEPKQVTEPVQAVVVFDGTAWMSRDDQARQTMTSKQYLAGLVKRHCLGHR